MPIVLNTNAAATEATFNLSKANDNLRRSIARLSSGNRITRPTDDAGGLAVAYKLQSSVKRTEAALNNHQNALSYLQVQDGVLEAIGEIVDRMAELRTMAADVSKNTADVENYSKEFLELQDQLAQMKREKFNGVELFATEEEWDSMQGINKDQLIINGADYQQGALSLGTKEKYEYFDHPDSTSRTNSEFDKYEFQLFTHPSGEADDGSIKLNVVNLQFMLGIKNPGIFGIDSTRAYPDMNGDGAISAAEWKALGYDTTPNDTIDDDEIADFNALGNGFELFGTAQSEQDLTLDIDGDGTLADDRVYAAVNRTAPGTNPSALYTETNDLPDGNTISIASTINLAGLNQPTLDSGNGEIHASNNGTNYSSFLTSEGYIKDITKISIEEFTNIIEKIADVRAENGAEQARVNQSLSLHQNNLVNLQAAHGRIMDVDVAMESTRLARHSVTVQASAAMVAQANQMTAVALTLLSN
jgi:flagellin-like hook-associated protein FlgL